MYFTLRSAATFTMITSIALGLSACKKPAAPDTASDTPSVQGETSNEFVGSIGDLMKDGKDVTCTFTRSDAAGDMQGTVYVTRDGKMYGEFALTNAQFGAMNMKVIRDGEYGYTWGFPYATQGTKVKLDENGKPIKDNDKESGIDDAMEYRCSSWNVDEAMLRVPSDVTFQDLSAQMEQINNAMQGVRDAKCGACDSIPDPSGKATCLQAMGCGN